MDHRKGNVNLVGICTVRHNYGTPWFLLYNI